MDTDTDMEMRQKVAPRRLEARRSGLVAGMSALALFCLPADVAAQSTRVTPTLDTALTWTDNAGIDRDGGRDWLFEVSPGLSVSRSAGRLNGSLSARLRNLVHSAGSEDDSTYLSFDGRGAFEAVEDLLFLDFSGGITRNDYSAFSQRAPGDPFGFDEDNEARYWSITPRLESDLRFGEAARGSVSYSSSGVRSNSGGLGDQSADTWGLSLADPGGFRFLGWGLNYTRSDSDGGTAATGQRSEESVRGTLYANLSPQLRLRGIVGHESNDYADGVEDSSGIVGAGVDWYPTDRTSITATVEDRVFGRGYDLGLNHRMRRAVFFLGAGRDVSSLAQSLGTVVLADRDCFARVREIADPIEREQALIECLSLGVLRSNSAYVERSFRGGFSLLGVRNTFSLSASRSDRSRIGSITGLLPDDDLRDTERVRITTATLAWSHTLSGTSSLYATLARSDSEGAADADQELRRLTGTVGVDRTLGPRTRAGLRYQYEKTEGDRDYATNSVTATLGMRF
jgi:uncharacterized protein (PEP-CTERM system associated)